MDRPHLVAVVALAILGVAALGCEPKFHSSGSLLFEDSAFQPSACHVLVGATGIELLDTVGARLELTLPCARLEAFHTLGGTPRATFEPGRDLPAIDFGICGTLTLRGEGYHASGKRAASGSMRLSCTSGATLKGDLRFDGCF